MLRVLIIEDEFLTALDLEAILTREGATSFAFAHTEAEALAEAHRDPPDVIISDVRLREGSGIAAVAAIRTDIGLLPVLFATANPAECEALSQPKEILEKPLDEGRVLEAFKRLKDTL